MTFRNVTHPWQIERKRIQFRKKNPTTVLKPTKRKLNSCLCICCVFPLDLFPLYGRYYKHAYVRDFETCSKNAL